MLELDYSAASAPIRSDLQGSHREILEHLRSPGTWWTGAERMAIAAESRAAAGCALCRERKAAISPNAVAGEHDGEGRLPSHVVDVIHRIRTDSGRLSKAWFDEVTGADLDVAKYVELVGVVTLTAGLDYFAAALGIPLFALPEPLAGEPSRHVPAGLTEGEAWVPMLDPTNVSGPDADVFGPSAFVPNIVRSLSSVPDQVRALRANASSHYFDVETMSDPTARRDLDRLQIELVAARVSAMNECFY